MLKRLLPLLLIALVLTLFYAFDLGRLLSFAALAEHRTMLLAWVEAHPIVAPLSYILLYITVVAFSLPGGMVMSISGGFLFGTLDGGIYAVFAATVGATTLFLVAKTSIGDYLLARAGGSVKRMQQGFAEDALNYLFVLRLIPIFPFFLVNLAPAFLGISLRVYLIATAFGIMPGTFIYALTGSGLGSVLAQGGEITLAGIFTPQVIGALVGLALLALLPVIYKHLSSRRLPAEGVE